MHIYVLFNLLIVNFRNAYLDSFSIFSKTVRRIPSKKYFCNTHVIVYLILEYQANQIGRCIFEHLSQNEKIVLLLRILKTFHFTSTAIFWGITVPIVGTSRLIVEAIAWGLQRV